MPHARGHMLTTEFSLITSECSTEHLFPPDAHDKFYALNYLLSNYLYIPMFNHLSSWIHDL